MQKPQVIFSAIVVPCLILSACLFFWSGLNAIDFFNSTRGGVTFLVLPFCIYSAAMLVWILNPARRDIVPAMTALITTLSFLLGAAVLTNSVGLGLNPMPVFDIFFTSKGLNQTLPYFMDHSDELNSHRTIFNFLISPAIASLAGFFLSCLIRREKSGALKERLKKGGIRFAIVTLAFVALLFGASVK
ncbi:MAG: hypothetical protein MUC48_24380 [Leptolyngbya sp. Prado105]|jgi:hypothetical protein|nr:hypothetical protein [Leptolyngbya sp. Prado105]